MTGGIRALIRNVRGKPAEVQDQPAKVGGGSAAARGSRTGGSDGGSGTEAGSTKGNGGNSGSGEVAARAPLATAAVAEAAVVPAAASAPGGRDRRRHRLRASERNAPDVGVSFRRPRAEALGLGFRTSRTPGPRRARRRGARARATVPRARPRAGRQVARCPVPRRDHRSASVRRGRGRCVDAARAPA